MSRVLFAGLATLDIISYVPSYPQADDKMRAEEQMIHAGGPAANAAVANAALGGTSILYTGLGSHSLAKTAAEELCGYGVEIIDDTLIADQLPVVSSVVVDRGLGSRSVVYSDPGGRKLSGSSLDTALVEGVELLLVDGFYLDQAVELASRAAARNIPVILDGGSWKDGLEKLLPYVRIAICSEKFTHPGCDTTDELIEQLRGYGIVDVAISRGGRSLKYFRDSESGEIEVCSVENPDTLGAGDILHGAFCYFYTQGGFITSLQQATVVATESCRYSGTRRWIAEYRQKATAM